MPVVGEAVFARILAHGRNPDAIPEGNVAELEWGEKIHAEVHFTCFLREEMPVESVPPSKAVILSRADGEGSRAG